jgi:hypothetical protein
MGGYSEIVRVRIYEPPEAYIGGLVLFPEAGGHVLAVLDTLTESAAVARWGDAERALPLADGNAFMFAADAERFGPSAGVHVGRWFPSLRAAVEALRPHLKRPVGSVID